MQPLHVLFGADRVVQTRQLEAVVVVSEVVETGNKKLLFVCFCFKKIYCSLINVHLNVSIIRTWKRGWSKLG